MLNSCHATGWQFNRKQQVRSLGLQVQDQILIGLLPRFEYKQRPDQERCRRVRTSDLLTPPRLPTQRHEQSLVSSSLHFSPNLSCVTSVTAVWFLKLLYELKGIRFTPGKLLFPEYNWQPLFFWWDLRIWPPLIWAVLWICERWSVLDVDVFFLFSFFLYLFFPAVTLRHWVALLHWMCSLYPTQT